MRKDDVVGTQTTTAWLLLAFGERRQHGGNAGYDDDLTSAYRYDSFVPNHKRIKEGHIAFLANHDGLQTIARIARIEASSGTRIQRRRPRYHTTGFKGRKTMAPTFRCNNGHEFDKPAEATVECMLFTAHLLRPVIQVNDGISKGNLAAACPNYNGQHAMQKLEPLRLLRQLLLYAPNAIGLLGETSRPATDSGNETPTSAGFRDDAASRKAIELRAMVMAASYYEELGYDVADTSSNKPYDLECRKGTSIRRVEVKGTTTAGDTVFLTAGEVVSAWTEGVTTDLFVVSQIAVNFGELVTASGGIAEIVKDWKPTADALTPTQYQYKVKNLDSTS